MNLEMHASYILKPSYYSSPCCHNTTQFFQALEKFTTQVFSNFCTLSRDYKMRNKQNDGSNLQVVDIVKVLPTPFTSAGKYCYCTNRGRVLKSSSSSIKMKM